MIALFMATAAFVNAMNLQEVDGLPIDHETAERAFSAYYQQAALLAWYGPITTKEFRDSISAREYWANYRIVTDKYRSLDERLRSWEFLRLHGFCGPTKEDK